MGSDSELEEGEVPLNPAQKKREKKSKKKQQKKQKRERFESHKQAEVVRPSPKVRAAIICRRRSASST